MIKFIILYVSITFFTVACISAQSSVLKYRALKIGDEVPDMMIRGIENYAKKNVKFSEFRGKYLLLDFWASGCVSCFAGFRKLTGLQKQFEKDFQAIIVNPYETREEARERMANPLLSDKAILPDLPSIIGDKRWDTLFPAPALGQQVWIDRNGKVVGISGSHNTNAETIKKLITTGELNVLTTPSFLLDLNTKRVRDIIDPNNSERTDFSVFSTFYEDDGVSISGMESGRVVDFDKATVRYSYINCSYLTLYYKALKMLDMSLKDEGSPRQIIYELASPNYFIKPETDLEVDNYYRRNNFCYEIELPLKEESRLAGIMWRELNNYIGKTIGIRARLENRARLTRVFRIGDSTKLKASIGGKSYTRFPNIKNGETTIGFFNMPVEAVLKEISNMLVMDKNILRTSDGFIPLPTLVEVKKPVNIDLEIPYGRLPQRQFLKDLYAKLNSIGVKVEEEFRETSLLILYDR